MFKAKNSSDRLNYTSIMNDSGFQDEFLDNNYNECDAPPKFNVVISTLIGSVLAMIGICSNLFLLYVFLRKKRNITTFLYYVVLAILDLLMCISYIVWLGNYKLSQYFELSFLYDLCSEYVFFVNWISKIIQMSIPYIIIAATAERLERIANINPVVKTGSRRALNVVLILAIIILCRIPLIGGFTVVINPNCTEFTKWFLTKTPLSNERIYWIQDVFINFIHTFVSFVILLILNIVIIQKHRQGQQASRRQSSLMYTTLLVQVKNTEVAQNEERREKQRLRSAIRTSVVIISSYLACNSLNFILYNLENFANHLLLNADGNEFSEAYDITSDLTSILFVLSSSTRLFIYYKYNDDIRSQILEILKCNDQV